MENLRDKFNSVPQEFDQTKMWNNIKAKKKKKRRFLWFWLLPLLATGTFLLFQTFDYSDTKPDYTEVINTKESNIAVEPQIDLKSEIDRNKNSKESTLNQDSQIDLKSGHNRTQNFKKSITNQKEAINSIGVSVSDESTYSSQINTKIKSKTKLRNLEIHNFPTNNNLSNLKEESFAKEIFDTNQRAKKINQNMIQRADINKPLSKNNETIDISFLETYLSKLTLSRNELPIRKLQPYIVDRSKYDLPFYIRFGIGLGKDNHKFQIINRTQEKDLESLIASLELEQFIYTKISLAGRLTYVRNTTNVKFENQQSAIALQDGSLINDKYVTKYNLYNHYSRFDAVVNLKYAVEFKNFSISPSVGVGYNLLSKVDGETSIDGEILTNLSSQDYKKSNGIFGELGIDLGYQLSNNISIGLFGNMQTVRKLDRSDNHTIQPNQLSLFIKKTIK